MLYDVTLPPFNILKISIKKNIIKILTYQIIVSHLITVHTVNLIMSCLNHNTIISTIIVFSFNSNMNNTKISAQ
ncbi:hypothetical protein ECH_0068 [Ehrlichia chaffeensis str. Arkansas]|uniref:Uncharacterized protein n=1 Tax=Ehrlichia chaffeensis (strain ATCC CRL-10679 / Arkansas) TaxID=205920 RepID=Q2GI35_EHRCR|nr:hypothetical protein ECH_0068 [Ehrlichia chaffeensis str. Arkansas]